MKITKSTLKRMIKEELTKLEEQMPGQGADGLHAVISGAIDDYQRDMTDHGSAEPFSTRASAQINALVAAVQAAMANPGPPVR